MIEIRFNLSDQEVEKLSIIKNWLKESKNSRTFRFLLNEKYLSIKSFTIKKEKKNEAQ